MLTFWKSKIRRNLLNRVDFSQMKKHQVFFEDNEVHSIRFIKDELVSSSFDGFLSFLRLKPFEKSLEEKMSPVELRQASLMEVQLDVDDIFFDQISENEIVVYTFDEALVMNVDLKQVTMAYTHETFEEGFISHWWIQFYDEETE